MFAVAKYVNSFSDTYEEVQALHDIWLHSCKWYTKSGKLIAASGLPNEGRCTVAVSYCGHQFREIL